VDVLTNRRFLLLAPVAVALALSLRLQGLNGIFWCYPAVVFAYFVLSTRVAAAFSAAVFALAAVVIERQAGAGAAVRLGVPLGLIILILTAMLSVRGDAQRRLAEQAIMDPLTGAFNRRHMDACLTTAIERRSRSGEPVSLLLFDVDRFKDINDALGHVAGDDVLKALVKIVGSRARKLDVLFRIGGEEFALLLSGARFADALSVAEDLRSLVERTALLERRTVTISIGVSELGDGQSAHGWLEDADAALYLAKQSGRNRVVGKEATGMHVELKEGPQVRVSVPM
jgi:diguanylate cyclase (GGDEF)-like protein